jgi:hypothetical protein
MPPHGSLLLPDTQTSPEATPEEKLHHFIGLSAGRFPFSGGWEGRVPQPEGYRELAATPVVNVMLIEWQGEAAQRRGIGKIFVEHWKVAKPEYKVLLG